MNINQESTESDFDDLVKRVRTDREAFAALFDRYYPLILKYCSRRVYPQSVGEDLTSDVFLTAASKIDGFRGLSDREFSQWLYTIATNRVNEYLRRLERERRLMKTAEFSSQRIANPSESDPHTDHLDWPVVYNAIIQLNPRDQTLITLRYVQDLPHDQIATILNLRTGTVRVAINRALKKLRAIFESDNAAFMKGDSK